MGPPLGTRLYRKGMKGNRKKDINMQTANSKCLTDCIQHTCGVDSTEVPIFFSY